MAAFTPLLDSLRALIAPSEPLPELKEFIPVQTYIWADRVERLVPEVWSFDIFVKEKLWRWVGKGSGDNKDYAIVDERRALNGKTKSPLAETSLGANQPPEFGHALLSQFCFNKDFTNLNHGKCFLIIQIFNSQPSIGSYGSLPRPVADASTALMFEIEERPDRYYRRDYYIPLKTVRERLAYMIGAETDEVVLVPNATHGVNTVLRNIEWGPDDIIVEGILFLIINIIY